MNRVLVMSVALACLTGAAAHAEEEGDDFSRNGWYVGAYGVYALDFYRGSRDADFDDSFGANLRFGYRGYEWFALEAEFEWINKFDSDCQGGIESRTLIGGVNGRFYPVGGRFQPYALIGANGMNVRVQHESTGYDDRETDWGIRSGLGLDTYITRNVVLSLEGSYVLGLGDVWETDYISAGAGILFRF